MDRKEQLWLSRGEALGRLLSENRRVAARPTASGPAASRPAEPRPAVDPFVDPLNAARFSASIALAMRNGAMDKAKQARAEAVRTAFRGLVRAVRNGFAAWPMTSKPGARVSTPVPVRQRLR